jgi:hypothetical protein
MANMPVSGNWVAFYLSDSVPCWPQHSGPAESSLLYVREEPGDAPESRRQVLALGEFKWAGITKTAKEQKLRTRLVEANFRTCCQSSVFSSHWRGILCYLAGHPIVVGREGLKFSFTTPDGLVAG